MEIKKRHTSVEIKEERKKQRVQTLRACKCCWAHKEGRWNVLEWSNETNHWYDSLYCGKCSEAVECRACGRYFCDFHECKCTKECIHCGMYMGDEDGGSLPKGQEPCENGCEYSSDSEDEDRSGMFGKKDTQKNILSTKLFQGVVFAFASE